MCGLLSGISFMRFFLLLCILFLPLDVFAASTVTGNTIDMMLNGAGQWELSNLPAASGSGTISDGPSFYYFTNPNNTPAVDSVGDVTANLPAPALPVPGDTAGIPGITSTDMVKASDIAAGLLPVLAQLFDLTPEGRAAVVGGSALWSMYENYMVSLSGGSGSSVNLSCGSSPLTPPFSDFVVSNGMYSCYGNGSPNPCDSPTGYCFAISNGPGICPVANVGLCPDGSNPVQSGSSSGSVPAPTLANVANMLAHNATNSLTALQNMPASAVQALPMTQTLTGPSTATGPSTTSTSTDSAGNTVSTTTTPTYNIAYSGPNATVTTTDNSVTKTCTAAGACTTISTSSQPVMQTPFVGPPVNFGPSGLTAALQGMQQTVPFSSIGFGSSWLPQSCPAQPSWPVSLPFGFSQTFTLPTNELCTVASDLRPFVLSGGGVLSLMILAW